MNKIDKLRDYLLDNFVDEDGDLDLEGLDFSNFEGDVVLGGMKVKGSLYQCDQTVGGNLYQDFQNVQGDLYQGNHIVKGDYVCRGITVGGSIYIDKPIKSLKDTTREELAEMGFRLKGE